MFTELRHYFVGFAAGVVGAILGFYPIGYLHYYLIDQVINAAGGLESASTYLLYLVGGVPLTNDSVLVLPIGGGLFGLLASFIILKKYHQEELSGKEGWVAAGAGALAGCLFNFFVSFWGH